LNHKNYRIDPLRANSILDAVKSEILTNTTDRNERKKKLKEEFVKICDNHFSVIIDCDWENEHNEKDLKSLKQQIIYCNAINRRATTPVHIYITSVGDKLRGLLTKANVFSWVSFHPHDEDYMKLQCFSNKTDENSNNDDTKRVKKLVYLTSDAEETLETLDDNTAYIIGGIVDRNRLKGVTYNKARHQNISTAKLPIKENYSLSSTHVLTVNHVFNILLEFRHTNCWKTAIQNVMPQRKGLKDHKEDNDDDNDEDNDDDNNEDNNDDDNIKDNDDTDNNNNNDNEDDDNDTEDVDNNDNDGAI